MDINKYQTEALKTDQREFTNKPEDAIISLLGLAGETGSLITEFKKRLRDGESYELFIPKLRADLGDILWYVANIASRLNLDLRTIAIENIYKVQERWNYDATQNNFLDDRFPDHEKLPRKFTVSFEETTQGGKTKVIMKMDGNPIGDPLTDNSYIDDNYRFHDVFHLAHVAILGWSPVFRALINKKRKSNPKVDEVEDGARAKILEELIVAFVYNDAAGNKLYSMKTHLDNELISNIRSLVSGLEVSARPAADWQQAILKGYEIFRQVIKNKGGLLSVDIEEKSIVYSKE